MKIYVRRKIMKERTWYITFIIVNEKKSLKIKIFGQLALVTMWNFGKEPSRGVNHLGVTNLQGGCLLIIDKLHWNCFEKLEPTCFVLYSCNKLQDLMCLSSWCIQNTCN